VKLGRRSVRSFFLAHCPCDRCLDYCPNISPPPRAQKKWVHLWSLVDLYEDEVGLCYFFFSLPRVTGAPSTAVPTRTTTLSPGCRSGSILATQRLRCFLVSRICIQKAISGNQFRRILLFEWNVFFPSIFFLFRALHRVPRFFSHLWWRLDGISVRPPRTNNKTFFTT